MWQCAGSSCLSQENFMLVLLASHAASAVGSEDYPSGLGGMARLGTSIY